VDVLVAVVAELGLSWQVSATIENDERTVIEGEATKDGFRIRAGEAEMVTPAGAVTSDSFWVAATMEAPKVANARTGETATPAVKDLFEHGPVEATVRFEGDFLAEAEVDSNGHTVKLVRVDA
jgi:hypothetical protein